jgi:hypothetical protein
MILSKRSKAHHLTLEVVLGCCTLLCGGFPAFAASSSAMQGTPAGAAAKQAAPAAAPGTPFSQDKLTAMLPATVYFAGRTAPLQLRNAAGVQFAGGSIFWAALVDSSGYATSVQEKYQFYLVTEGALRIGNLELRAGAYGGGFVGDRFVIMDLGNHTIGEGPTQVDAAMHRPRPLQLVSDQSNNNARLYLGRRWVSLQPVAH